MNAEDIKMGEWYNFPYEFGDHDICTPISTECDDRGRAAFRSDLGHIFTASIKYMESVPQPVVFTEQWMVMTRLTVLSIWDSLRDAEAAAKMSRSNPIGILHLRTDGSTEMLEV